MAFKEHDMRRRKMCLKFAKQSLKIDKFSKLFPRKETVHGMSKRKSDAYELVKPRTTRYQFSAIPAIQRKNAFILKDILWSRP